MIKSSYYINLVKKMIKFQTQIKIGNDTEQNIAKILQTNHYWVHRMANTSGGQPVDIIAVNGYKSKTFLFDSKHCEQNKSSFDFNRVEPNQEQSMNYMIDFCGINKDYIGFVIFFEKINEFKWFSYTNFKEMKKQGHKSVNMNDENRLYKLEDIF